MKNRNKLIKKTGVTFLLVLCLAVVFAFFTSAADSSFEQSIAAFPESYKPQLRALHEKYPQWEFIPFETGLNWNDVIKGEYGTQSVVYADSASRIFRSHDQGDYNPTTDAYTEYDWGAVQASRFAVEYFMDPRNFLTEDNIFMFELLSFNDSFTVEMVDRVLKGSFMYATKVSYLEYNKTTGKLTTVNTDKTYADLMFAAGKKYDINPCYLASKILNEIGNDGSYSIYGNHPDYPGIYNFYNIGASDGDGAIARGLLWASGGTSGSTYYGRPWNTPEKSIMGGAQFLAEEYIACGQFTGYLQRFNVNPEADYSLYQHQYMTNVTGAVSQGYTTYCSYASMGMLDTKIIFSIPVFENMSGEDDYSGTVNFGESMIQYGNINTSRAVLRTGPSNAYANVTTSGGGTVSLSADTKVKIISKHFTDSEYYLRMLSCPVWYKVSVTVKSITYTGYVDADFVDITTHSLVPAGDLDMALFRSNKTLSNSLISLDYRYCSVVDSDTVTFKGNGSVEVVMYNSTGGYDKVKYTVAANAVDYAVSKITVSAGENSIKVSLPQSADAQRYGFYLKDSDGKFVKGGDIASNSYTFSNLKSGRVYTVYGRYVPSFNNKNGVFKSQTAITKPNKATNLTYVYTGDSLVLNWDIAESCTGYKIYSYDNSTGGYTRIGTVTTNTGKFTVPETYADESCFMVRSYVLHNGTTVHADYSEHLVTSRELSVPSDLKLSDVTTNGYTLSWNGSFFADKYRVYRYLPDTKKYVFVCDTENTSVKITGLEPGYLCAYRVRAFEGTQFTENSSALWALTLPQKVTSLTYGTVTKNSIELSWDAVINASFYRVYTEDPLTGKVSLLAETRTTNYVAEKLSQGEEYTFFVNSVVDTRGMIYESESSESLHLATIPADVTGLTAKSGDEVTLSWTKVPKADFYEIYVYDYNTSQFVFHKSTADTSVSFDDVEPLRDHRFKVVSVKSTNNGTFRSSGVEATARINVPAVTGVRASDITATSYKISWDPIEGASYYTIYRVDGSYLVKIVTINETEYTLTDLTPSTKTFYRISANYIEGNVLLEGALTEEFSVATLPDAVKNLKGTVYADRVDLNWTEVKNADCYNVYTREKGVWVLKQQVTTNNCVLTGLSDITSYSVRVRGYIRTTTGTQKGALATYNFTTMAKSITSMKVSGITPTSYTLTWNASSKGVNRYNLYRFNSTKNAYSLIAATSSTSYTVKNLKPGSTDTYCVIPYIMKNNSVYLRGYVSQGFTFSTYLEAVTGLKASSVTDDSMTLSWKAAENASYYRIYQYNTSTKTYTQIGSTRALSFKVSGLDSSTKYYFRIRAVRNDGGTYCYGYYSSVISAVTK